MQEGRLQGRSWEVSPPVQFARQRRLRLRQAGWAGSVQVPEQGDHGDHRPQPPWGGEETPEDSALGSWAPRSRAGEGGGLGLALPRGRGAGNQGGSLESLRPGRPVAGSTVDPVAPVPKETCSEMFPRQKYTRPKPQGRWSSSPNLSLSGSAQTPQDPSTALAHGSKASAQAMPDSWYPFL